MKPGDEREVRMTPELASEMLAATDKGGLTLQRKGIPSVQATLRTKMLNGRWLSPHDYAAGSVANVRASDGVVIQGRNRLAAIAAIEKPGFSLPWLVTYVSDDVAREILKAQLDGRPKWSIPDYIGANYPVRNLAQFAATLRTCLWLDNGQYGDALNDEIVDDVLMPKYRTHVAWSIEVFSKNARARVPAPISGVFAWCHKRARGEMRDRLATLAEQVYTGFHIEPGDPANIIRNLFVGTRQDSGSGKQRGKRRVTASTHQVDRWESAVLTLRLVEAALAGEQLHRKPTINRENVSDLIGRVERTLRTKLP